eukprot:TRINITY_DN11120_c0_g3_i1.p1 TRINITY_DN11120_c0_g3~~TRINITY_DN11120_c0_g3_i1.p1  ORF type:complete len:1870 (+),score=422.72 TRINITY_DN11120_c0_g3_i1:78-5612(+)
MAEGGQPTGDAAASGDAPEQPAVLSPGSGPQTAPDVPLHSQQSALSSASSHAPAPGADAANIALAITALGKQIKLANIDSALQRERMQPGADVQALRGEYEKKVGVLQGLLQRTQTQLSFALKKEELVRAKLREQLAAQKRMIREQEAQLADSRREYAKVVADNEFVRNSEAMLRQKLIERGALPESLAPAAATSTGPSLAAQEIERLRCDNDKLRQELARFGSYDNEARQQTADRAGKVMRGLKLVRMLMAKLRIDVAALKDVIPDFLQPGGGFMENCDRWLEENGELNARSDLTTYAVACTGALGATVAKIDQTLIHFRGHRGMLWREDTDLAELRDAARGSEGVSRDVLGAAAELGGLGRVPLASISKAMQFIEEVCLKLVAFTPRILGEVRERQKPPRAFGRCVDSPPAARDDPGSPTAAEAAQGGRSEAAVRAAQEMQRLRMANEELQNTVARIKREHLELLEQGSPLSATSPAAAPAGDAADSATAAADAGSSWPFGQPSDSAAQSKESTTEAKEQTELLPAPVPLPAAAEKPRAAPPQVAAPTSPSGRRRSSVAGRGAGSPRRNSMHLTSGAISVKTTLKELFGSMKQEMTPLEARRFQELLDRAVGGARESAKMSFRMLMDELNLKKMLSTAGALRSVVRSPMPSPMMRDRQGSAVLGQPSSPGGHTPRKRQSVVGFARAAAEGDEPGGAREGSAAGAEAPQGLRELRLSLIEADSGSALAASPAAAPAASPAAAAAADAPPPALAVAPPAAQPESRPGSRGADEPAGGQGLGSMRVSRASLSAQSPARRGSVASVLTRRLADQLNQGFERTADRARERRAELLYRERLLLKDAKDFVVDCFQQRASTPQPQPLQAPPGTARPDSPAPLEPPPLQDTLASSAASAADSSQLSPDPAAAADRPVSPTPSDTGSSFLPQSAAGGSGAAATMGQKRTGTVAKGSARAEPKVKRTVTGMAASGQKKPPAPQGASPESPQRGETPKDKAERPARSRAAPTWGPGDSDKDVDKDREAKERDKEKETKEREKDRETKEREKEKEAKEKEKEKEKDKAKEKDKGKDKGKSGKLTASKAARQISQLMATTSPRARLGGSSGQTFSLSAQSSGKVRSTKQQPEPQLSPYELYAEGAASRAMTAFDTLGIDWQQFSDWAVQMCGGFLGRSGDIYLPKMDSAQMGVILMRIYTTEWRRMNDQKRARARSAAMGFLNELVFAARNLSRREGEGEERKLVEPEVVKVEPIICKSCDFVHPPHGKPPAVAISIMVQDGDMRYTVNGDLRPQFREMHFGIQELTLTMPDLSRRLYLPWLKADELAELLGKLRFLCETAGVTHNIPSEWLLYPYPRQMHFGRRGLHRSILEKIARFVPRIPRYKMALTCTDLADITLIWPVSAARAAAVAVGMILAYTCPVRKARTAADSVWWGGQCGPVPVFANDSDRAYSYTRTRDGEGFRSGVDHEANPSGRGEGDDGSNPILCPWRLAGAEAAIAAAAALVAVKGTIALLQALADEEMRQADSPGAGSGTPAASPQSADGKERVVARTVVRQHGQKLGLHLSVADLRLEAVDAGGAAEKAGLGECIGYRLVQVAGMPVCSAQDAAQLLCAASQAAELSLAFSYFPVDKMMVRQSPRSGSPRSPALQPGALQPPRRAQGRERWYGHQCYPSSAAAVAAALCAAVVLQGQRSRPRGVGRRDGRDSPTRSREYPREYSPRGADSLVMHVALPAAGSPSDATRQQRLRSPAVFSFPGAAITKPHTDLLPPEMLNVPTAAAGCAVVRPLVSAETQRLRSFAGSRKLLRGIQNPDAAAAAETADGAGRQQLPRSSTPGQLPAVRQTSSRGNLHTR